jgi:uroporphyrinogen decarboxylase
LAKERLTHRERLETCLAGGRPDRTPVALWRHFPVDDQDADSLVAAVLDFQRQYDFDLVKVTPASSFCTKDWGVEDEWRGALEGTRDYTRRPINQPEDWTKLPVLDPHRGSLGNQLEVLRRIVHELGPDTPALQTVFSPLMQAKYLVGPQNLLVHLRRYPEAVHTGLDIIAESTQRFVEAALETGAAGIFYAAQYATYALLSPAEYAAFGQAYDLPVLEVAKSPSSNSAWLNMLHLHGDEVMFENFLDYPAPVLNWHDRDTYPSLGEARK